MVCTDPTVFLPYLQIPPLWGVIRCEIVVFALVYQRDLRAASAENVFGASGVRAPAAMVLNRPPDEVLPSAPLAAKLTAA